MSDYCTLEDIKQVISEAELIQLTDDNNISVNIDVVDSAIKYAQTTINGYLRSRYTLPLIEIPELLKVFAVDLVVYRLHSRRLVRDMPESLENSYKNVIGELGKIQKGIVTLGIESQTANEIVPDHQEYFTYTTLNRRLFDRDTLNKF